VSCGGDTKDYRGIREEKKWVGHVNAERRVRGSSFQDQRAKKGRTLRFKVDGRVPRQVREKRKVHNKKSRNIDRFNLKSLEAPRRT